MNPPLVVSPLLSPLRAATGLLAFALLALPAVAAVPRVDILIAYTAAVEAYHGGRTGVEAHVAALVAGANLALEDSAINGEFRMVHLHRVDYVESPDSLNTDLSRMWNPADGYMDELAGLREETGADLVCLLRKGFAGGASGSGYILRDEGGRDDVAFSVVSTEFASSTFVHELGHNFGAHHARGDMSGGVASWGGLHAWSNGFRFEGANGTGYRTLMAYAPGFQLMRFSSPMGAYEGQPTGIDGGWADSADNGRTMEQMFPIVAAYREAHDADSPEPGGVLSIDPVARNVLGFPDSYTVQVEADGPWALGSLPDWITASVSSGSGFDGVVTIDVAPFDGTNGFFGPRTATVLIGDQAHEVTQEAVVPRVAVQVPSEAVPSIGGEIWLSIESNIAWTAHSGSPQWATLGTGAHAVWRGEGDRSLRVVMTENFGATDRTATITVHDQSVTLTQRGVISPPDEGDAFVAQLRMGAAAFARFDGINGKVLADLYAAAKFPDHPDSVEEENSFEWVGSGDNFGVRAWAWLVPETSGTYTFWIASDDQGSLSLSPSSDSTAAAVIARVLTHTPPRRFTLHSEQMSAPVYLEAGRAYYLEAHMKQGWSGVNLAVAWAGPGFSQEVIPGRVLGLLNDAPEDEEPPANPAEPDLTLTGKLSLAFYRSVVGRNLEDLFAAPKFPDSPDEVVELDAFSFLGEGIHYGLHAWGWLVPETSGEYTFWLASDDEGELQLSPSADPNAAVRIAHVPDYTPHLNFDRFDSQRSSVVQLEAGKPYFISATAQQGGGGVNLSVAWQGPGFSRIVIPGSVLTNQDLVDGDGDPEVAWEMGGLAVARYDGVMGKLLADLDAAPNYPAAPTTVRTLTTFDYPESGDNFGLHAWAWLIPEHDGFYRFWLASDDQGELLLSPDDDPGRAAVIATVSSHTNPYQYEKMESQRSAEIWLHAGRAYSIQARVQQGWGGNHLSVAWSGPGFGRETILGRVLALPPETTHQPPPN